MSTFAWSMKSVCYFLLTYLSQCWERILFGWPFDVLWTFISHSSIFYSFRDLKYPSSRSISTQIFIGKRNKWWKLMAFMRFYVKFHSATATAICKFLFKLELNRVMCAVEQYCLKQMLFEGHVQNMWLFSANNSKIVYP